MLPDGNDLVRPGCFRVRERESPLQGILPDFIGGKQPQDEKHNRSAEKEERYEHEKPMLTSVGSHCNYGGCWL